MLILHSILHAEEHPMAKRSFTSIEQLPSKRWRVRYTGPDGTLHKAPSTFRSRIDAEAWAAAQRRRYR